MRITKFFAGAVSVGLLGLPVVTASSAAAEDPAQVPTRVAKIEFSPYLKAFKKPTSVHKENLSLRATVQAQTNTGSWVTAPDNSGTQYVLERRLAGEKNFKAVKTGTAHRGVIEIYGMKVARNAAYRFRFLGGSTIDGTSSVLAASTGTQKLQVMRKFGKLKVNKAKRTFSGKIGPAYKRKVVHIQRKNCEKGCKWKPYAKVKTTKHSRFAVKLQARKSKKWFYRAVVPKNKQFIKSASPSAWIVIY